MKLHHPVFFYLVPSSYSNPFVSEYIAQNCDPITILLDASIISRLHDYELLLKSADLSNIEKFHICSLLLSIASHIDIYGFVLGEIRFLGTEINDATMTTDFSSNRLPPIMSQCHLKNTQLQPATHLAITANRKILTAIFQLHDLRLKERACKLLISLNDAAKSHQISKPVFVTDLVFSELDEMTHKLNL